VIDSLELRVLLIVLTVGIDFVARTYFILVNSMPGLFLRTMFGWTQFSIQYVCIYVRSYVWGSLLTATAGI